MSQVRVSLTIALPTDEEIEEAGAGDAGEFLLAMRATSPQGYARFVETHRPRHTDPDGSDYEAHALQPAHRCVEHLLRVIVRTVEHNVSNTAATEMTRNVDGVVEPSEAAKFLQRRRQGADLGQYAISLQAVDFEATIENAATKKLLTTAAITIQLAKRARDARRRVAERMQIMKEQGISTNGNA